MATRGYIKVDRAALDHPLFKRAEYSEFEAWIWLLAEAAWRPEQRRAGDYLVSVDRGQLVASVRFLASAWSWDRNRVERFVKRLKNQDMIETQTETGISIITICNYNKYQGDEEEIETPLRRDARQMRDTSETGARQMRDNKKETNKPSNEEAKKESIEIADTGNPPAREPLTDDRDRRKGPLASSPAERPTANGQGASAQQSLIPLDQAQPPAKRPRKTRTALPPDWRLPDDGWTYAAGKGLTGDRIEQEAEKFRDYHLSRGNVMADWAAAWRTWVGNAGKFSAPVAGNYRQNDPPSRADSAIAGIKNYLIRTGELP